MPIDHKEPPYPPVIMQCVEQASSTYMVPRIVLLGIIRRESRGNPRATHHNHNGTYDIGIMQVNTEWVKKLSKRGMRINYRNLLDPCYNIHLGAWIVRHELFADHNVPDGAQFWKRVANYHSHTEYFNRKYRIELAKDINWIAVNTDWWH